MSNKPPAKDEALEALDFIVNVLKDHEKDLDKLINELGTVAGKFGDTGELSRKVANVEQKISSLQNEITTLVSYLSASPHETPPMVKEPKSETETAKKGEIKAPIVMPGVPIVLRCKEWEGFQNLAFQAQTLSFLYKETDGTFQAHALTGNQVFKYVGKLPKLPSLLRMWLSKQLDISEKRVLEGTLSTG
jgi:hypothetical protein